MSTPEYVEMNEGYEPHIYLDSEGIETIGIGFNLQEGFSRVECLLILNYRLGNLQDRLRESFPWYSMLNQVRKTVLLDMAYNLGIPRLCRFTKMLGAIAEENWNKAAEELLDSRYAKQVGPRADRNAKMMRTGEWYE